MPTKRLLGYGLFGLLAAALIAGAYVTGYLVRPSEIGAGAQFPILAEARHIVETQFLGSVPAARDLEYGAIRGMLATLGDPYTVFVEPQPHELETHNLQGSFGGIGAELRRDESGEVVLSPFPDRPAARAGVQAGDALTAVDGKAITGNMLLEEISLLVRGPVGEPVTIEVRRGADQRLAFTIVREEIELPSVTWRVHAEDASLGIIVISRFSDKTADEIERALAELSAAGARGFVLDLRDNPGGLLEASVEVAGQFLDPGVVLYERRRGESERTFEAPPGGLAAEVPIVVLVNHGTASAAEIVAGALQARGRAPLIGESTFGKGSVQFVFDLSDGSSVHVTAARWFTPSRSGIDGVGLSPDVPVAPSPDGADVQLARAIEYLQNGK